MVDYVWVLHDFNPQEADEIPLKAGDRVQVIERDDLYQDGWWQGTNPEGKSGLFPKAYTTDQPPPASRTQPAEDHSRVAFPNVATPTAAASSAAREESISINGAHTNGSADERDRTFSEGAAAMQATLTDVQKAIEQLGRNNDNDGTRSFSFRSSHDDYSERSDTGTDAEDGDADDGDWHRNAREKLALRAQLENEQRIKESGSVPSTPMRVTAPPIDVELSDESDEEDGDESKVDVLKNQRRHSSGAPEFKARYSYIPEEDETEATEALLPAGRANFEDRSTTIVPSLPSAAAKVPTVSHSLPSPGSDNGHIVPSEDYIVPSPGVTSDDLPTATADRLTFPDVPFVASPDPSPSLSAVSEGTEPSPIPPPAPPPVAVVLSPVSAPTLLAAPAPISVPVPVRTSTPARTFTPTRTFTPAAAPAPVVAPAPAPVRVSSPARAPVPTSVSAPITTGTVMPGSLNPLSPVSPENEPTPVIPVAVPSIVSVPAPSIISSAPSTIKLAPIPIKTYDALPPASRTGVPSPGLPLPSPSVSSSAGSLGFSSGKQSSLTHATTPMSFKAAAYTPQQDLSPLGTNDSGKSPTTHPSEWSLEDVADWLMSKGFDQSVYEKFMEQEITGDVLLELNATILKDEIGIVKWGQRQRIMNAITELRRPRSFTEYDRQPVPGLPNSRSQSLNYGHSHTPSVQSSGYPSYNNSPLGYGGPGFSPSHSTHAISTSSMNMGPGGFGSFSSADAPIYQMPIPEPPTSASSRNGWKPLDQPAQISEATLNVPRPFEAVPEDAPIGAGPSHPMELLGLGLNAPASPPASRPQSPGTSTTASRLSKPRPSNLTVSSSDNHLNVTAVGEEEQPAAVMEEDRGAMSEPENQDPKAKRRRLFGRSNESASLKEKAASLKDVKESNSSRHSKESSAVTLNDGSSKISIGDQAPPIRRHSKKKSVDDRDRKGDRLSLFGGSFSGAISKKARKPVPRLSSGALSEKSEKSEKDKTKSEKADRDDKPDKAEKPEKSEHDWTSLATFTRMRHHSGRGTSGRPSTSDGLVKKEKEKRRESASPREKPKDTALLRKRTSSMSDQGSRTPLSTSSTPGMVGMAGMALKPGRSILEQIGTPDHNGWMRKKSDHYSTWKLRYFVLKGPHLYCLKSNDKSETKIKGYVNIVGYKVIADENIDPGRYGFRIVHDSDKTHYFSHDEQIVIREWMKALMKATISRDFTNPVVSSSNIPTIPLTVAQAMNPSPRPPSPSARAATQRAHRRENPNQLSSRDAQILLMAMPQKSPSLNSPSLNGSYQDGERARVESFFTNNTVPSSKTPEPPVSPKKPITPKAVAPPRPSREMRRKVATPPPDENVVLDDSLIDWANSHLPHSLQITDQTASGCGGLALLRIAEDIKGVPSSPPVPDSAFPSEGNDDKLDGLFALFDFLLENDVKLGAVSINDIRQGNKQKIVQILQALRAWEEKRRSVSASIAQGSGAGYMTGPVQYF